MISLIIPTTSKNKVYTHNIVQNIKSLYNDTAEIIVEENDTVSLGANYNNAVARASGEKIILLHNDMILSPGFVELMDKHIQPGRITTYTRVEPPIFNDTYPGKVILDCGTDLENFNSDKFINHELNYDLIDGGSQLFFGCMREDYIGIDGATFKMFCEDDDLHRRYKLLGFEHKVSCAAVYHFVSKTSRTTADYQHIEFNSNRNFIRKWGSRSDAPKYNISFIVKNCSFQVLELLEPWCDRLYIESPGNLIDSYITSEQVNTKFNLRTRVLNLELNDPHSENDIVVEFDSRYLDQSTFNLIQNLHTIIADSGEIGVFELGAFKIYIYNLTSYESELIHLST